MPKCQHWRYNEGTQKRGTVMPFRNLQDTTLQCSRCQTWNYPFASFCISCGGPFDVEVGDSLSMSTNGSTAQPIGQIEQRLTSTLWSRVTSRRQARWETIIGLLADVDPGLCAI